MKERIQKVLAHAGVASRRNVEEMVREGRVAVNGTIVRDLPVLIDAESDRVEVDGDAVRIASKKGRGGRAGGGGGDRIYILMNKPRGVYSTNVAQGEQKRAIDLLPAGLPGRVYPVGRLDAESRGLLLLTNDGELTNRLTHPRYGVAKTYRAVVDGFVTSEALEPLVKGVWLADAKTGKGFKTGRANLRIVSRGKNKSVLELTVREGRNQQVRRILAGIGHKVRELVRVKMGPLTLHGLEAGEFRELTGREVKELWKMGAGREGRAGGDNEK